MISILLPAALSAVAQLAAGGPLDELLEREATVVVAGRVASAAPGSLLDAGSELTLDVERVLKPESAEVPSSLALVAAAWPIDLALPLEPGVEVLAALVRDAESPSGYRLDAHVRAIVPIAIAALPAEIPPDRIAAIVAENVLRGAESVAHPVLRAGRIRLAAEALAADQRDLLLPFAASKEPWVRRAAIGAALRMGATPSDLDAAAKDFRRFLATPQGEVVLPTGARMSPLHLFLDSYGEIERAAVVKRDAERCAEFLPLYRAIADENDVVDPFRNERTFYRERIGLAGLAIAGTEADLGRLHAFAESETPATRQRALDAIARILGLPPVPADETEFAAREDEIRATAEKAMRDRGVAVPEKKKEKAATPPLERPR